MTQDSAPPDSSKLGKPATNTRRTFVMTERKAHEAWAMLTLKKPRAATLLHHLVARMGDKNALVVSQKTLGKLMGVTERTVRRAVADLVAEKWIAVVRLNGPGTVSAYVVNDQVAWGQPRGSMHKISTFSAQVIADADDQPEGALTHDDLRQIPTLFPGDEQLPSGSSAEPPTQPALDGFEHPLPERHRDEEGRTWEVDPKSGAAQLVVDESDMEPEGDQ